MNDGKDGLRILLRQYDAVETWDSSMDAMEFLDALVREVRRNTELVEVRFLWSPEDGICSDCGLPAAFWVTDAYDAEHTEPGEHDKRCAVCAANDAAEGTTVRRIRELD